MIGCMSSTLVPMIALKRYRELLAIEAQKAKQAKQMWQCVIAPTKHGCSIADTNQAIEWLSTISLIDLVERLAKMGIAITGDQIKYVPLARATPVAQTIVRLEKKLHNLSQQLIGTRQNVRTYKKYIVQLSAFSRRAESDPDIISQKKILNNHERRQNVLEQEIDALKLSLGVLREIK